MESKPYLMTQPADWLLAFQRQATAEGVPMSAWIGAQCKGALPRAAQRKLSKRVRAGAPKKKR